ncbi:MAG: Ig-like domain-containing protein [Paludibacteraceae bacterium]
MKTNKLFAFVLAALSLVACNKKNEVAVEKVSVDPATATIKVTETKQLSAVVTPEGAATVTWESSNPVVASVDDKGLVTAVASGEAYITATAGGKVGMCSVTVFEEGQTVVTLDKLSLSLVKGNSETLTATVVPADKATELVWSSDNEAVAIVKDGVVTAVAKGSANIKAAVGDVEAVCAVKVTDPTGGDEKINHVSLEGSDYFVIQLGEKEVAQIESKMIASFAQNTSDQTGSKNLYVWENTYAAGATQGKNFYGVTGEGWVSMTVTSVGWSGMGYSCGWGSSNPTPSGKEAEQTAAMNDLNKLAAIMDAPNDYYFHIAMKSTDAASHMLYLNGANNTKGGVCIGSAAFDDNGATYPAYTDFTRNGDWGEIEIPMSYFTKQGLVYTANNTVGINVLSILSGGVSGKQLQFDACFIYKKAK